LSYLPDITRYQQLLQGDPYGAFNCTAYAAAWITDAHTAGKTLLTGREVRAHTNEPVPDPNSPGLNLPQVDWSVIGLTGGKVNLDTRIWIPTPIAEALIVDGRWAVVPLLAPYFLLQPGDRAPPATSPGPLCPIAYGDSSFRTWLRDPREQGTDLGLPVPTVAAEGTDRRQLAGLCPACDGLGIHPEHGRHLCRREQRLGLGRACGHMYGLPFLDR